MELRINAQKKLNPFFLDVDFTIEGDRIGIFGPSGCGKSTLVSLIAGLTDPDRGRILINGQPVFDRESKVNIHAQHRRIGMVFQRPHLFPHLSVRANLLYGYKRCAEDQRKITLEHLVDVLQIGDLLHRGVNNLSGGEQQRVAIGRAVLSNPRMLIMDEPLSALDDSLKFQIIPFLKKSCEAFAIPYLFISHSLTEMRIMTERVLSMTDGCVTGQMTAGELARSAMGKSPFPYTNLLQLKGPRRIDGMVAYRFGDGELFISGGGRDEALYELSSTDIILFKRHPAAISARNLLKCRVGEIFEAGGRMGIGLLCGNEKLVAVVVKESVDDLEIREGVEVYAAVKATAFRELG
ncbi:MAG: molybdenum ABC transporter ATP-binding protein [Deltaproteobacteria bacterium HGW-Deltaproteobacteria-6]|nr:MAG: molybdenum ABC transporter ATP-binding protein [Deltaproteobacteria bacterium HGW-Deltaproteobacteria-6]